MSTPSITLTGAQSEYMYKKTLGVAYEYPGTQPSTETVSSLPYVFNNNIIPYNIPIPAPALDVSSAFGGGTKWTTDVSFIFYYEKLPLSINPDGQKYSFVPVAPIFDSYILYLRSISDRPIAWPD